MAREIKFRAWSKVEEEMVYGIDLTTQDGTAHPINGNWDNIMSLDERVELMQYTGLKDKNGVEIYEGDILEYYVEDDLLGKFLVKWDDKGFWDCGISNKNQAVIGNIYQSPELLKNNGGDTK